HHRANHRAHHRAHRRKPHSLWATGPAATRAAVRRAVVAAAHRHHVGPNLALAVAWQESGWQQRRISTAHAIGVMQVLPSTGRWVSSVLGRRLDLYRLHDNVTAGVYLLHLLHSATPRHALADYYQGSGSVHAHGRYPSTRHYIATVIALRDRLRHGWSPEK
ncbi:MAG: lytic transglycosylase domain-containing protein, partial [Nocardioidaceae bacterium]